MGIILTFSFESYSSVIMESSDGGIFGNKLRVINGRLNIAKSKVKLALFNKCSELGEEFLSFEYITNYCETEVQSSNAIKVNVCRSAASTNCKKSDGEVVSAVGQDGGIFSYKEIVKNGSIKLSYSDAVLQLAYKCQSRGMEIGSRREIVSFCSHKVLGSKEQLVSVCTSGVQATCK